MTKIEERVIEIVKRITNSNNYNNTEITLNTKFKLLGLDDVDCLDIIDEISKIFEIELNNDELNKWRKVSDIVYSITNKSKNSAPSRIDELSQVDINKNT